MKFVTNRHDRKNVKITVTQKILINETIGIWVIDKPMSNKSRYLFQKQMSKAWWETDDLGRYCNHSLTPNTIVVFEENQLVLKANKQIDSILMKRYLLTIEKLTSILGTSWKYFLKNAKKQKLK